MSTSASREGEFSTSRRFLLRVIQFVFRTSDAALVPVKKRKYDAQMGAQARPQVSLHQLLKNCPSTLGATAANKQLQELLAAGTRLVSLLEQYASVDDVVKDIDGRKSYSDLLLNVS